MITSGRFRVLCLWLSDMVTIAVVWMAVLCLYKLSGFGRYDLGAYLALWPILPLFTLFNLYGRLYHGRATYPSFPLNPVEELRRLVVSSVAVHMLIMAAFGFGRHQEDISRFVLVTSGILTGFLAPFVRDLTRGLLRRLGLGQIPAYIAGEGAAGVIAQKELLSSAYYGFRIVRTFDRDHLREIADLAVKEDVRHLFACYRDDRYFHTQFPELERAFTYIVYLPTATVFPASGSRPVLLGALGGLEIVDQHKLKILKHEKAVLDFVLSLVIFLCALPLFVVVPILIKLTSRGPVLYKAKRLGKKGRPIFVWKFRSMYADADQRLQALLDSDPALKAEFAKNFKLRNDPRITPLGRFLRKTSIDELPQLVNVFMRDMALVGPRPIVEKEIPYYGRDFETFSSVRPGITGLWQASGRSNTDYASRVALDVYYVNNWSPWLDIWIVFKTVSSVLGMKGAC